MRGPAAEAGRAPGRGRGPARAALVFLAAALAVLPEARGADRRRGAPPPADRTGATAISTTRRFVASGLGSADNVDLAISAEESADKLAELVGARIPFGRAHYVQLAARQDDRAGRGSVVKAQGWVDRQLSQKLIITNPFTVDQEDVLEGLCWLLLNRFVVVRQTTPQRQTRLGAVPDWLAVGLAQNLYAALRARNSYVVVRRWERGDAVPLSEVAAFEYLPPGRWSEKAFCGLAVGLVLSQPRAPDLFTEMFARLARGEDLTAEALAEILFGEKDVRELEKQWDLWIARQTQVRRAWGGVSEERLEAVRALSTIDIAELGAAGEGVPPGLSLRDLIERRNAPWMPKVALVLALRVRGLAVGEAPEFREVVEPYGEFFDALAASKPPPRRRLEALLDRAESLRAEFEEDLAERTRYVSQVEREYAVYGIPASISNTVEAMERVIPRSELQEYVDTVERMVGGEAPRRGPPPSNAD